MNLCFPLFLASLQSKSFVSTDGGSSGSKDAFIASVVVVGCIIIVIIFTTILRGNDFLLCIELWTRNL